MTPVKPPPRKGWRWYYDAEKDGWVEFRAVEDDDEAAEKVTDD